MEDNLDGYVPDGIADVWSDEFQIWLDEFCQMSGPYPICDNCEKEILEAWSLNQKKEREK